MARIDPYDLSPAAMEERARRARENPPIAVCSFCAWKGTPLWATIGPMMIATDETGRQREVSIRDEMLGTCPRCRRETALVEGLFEGFGESIDPLELTESEARVFSDVLARLDPARADPDDLLKQFPAMAPVINISVARGGSEWLAMLSFLVSAIIAVGAAVWAHSDAEKAAGIARQQQEQPLRLAPEDIEKIASEVESKRRRREQYEEWQRSRETQERRAREQQTGQGPKRASGK